MVEESKKACSNMKTSEPISDDSKVFLRRIIGIVPCIGFIIGIVIGTGIFVSPKGILRGVNGSVGLAFIIWIVCAVLSLFGGLCYTELAAMFSKSGGEFTYIKEAFGPTLAYLRVWTVLMILSPADMAIQSLTVATYQHAFPRTVYGDAILDCSTHRPLRS
ncbi:putative cystine/glutamate transporter [Apostichopus japonicus]|uniref:Putative cystine/glutamate transporter n=1 Tax=Stichopus japonicus TaxID=307972 RepID=A0A2G8KYK5_STIJA|nr:putative cystine/glutamate transporter [Apostichopus japonicus]